MEEIITVTFIVRLKQTNIRIRVVLHITTTELTYFASINRTLLHSVILYRFLHEICPGFYFKVDGGSGSMAHIQIAQLNIYFKNKQNGKVSEISTNFVSTEEVLQLTNFSNDNTKLQQLANESGHTYLKTPAGLFTKLRCQCLTLWQDIRMILSIRQRLFFTE